MIDPDSVVLWPDGDWCFYCELDEMNWKSDDYEIIPYSYDPGPYMDFIDKYMKE